jgi:LmbE family N-acetylglucosaminyl deacetylase
LETVEQENSRIMIKFNLDINKEKGLQVLCLGSHADDIEIGCGGSIIRLIRQYPNCRINWVVFSAIGIRKAEAERGAELFAGKQHLDQVHFHEFRDGFMPYVGSNVKDAFEELKRSVSPDIIFTHHRNDAHQDHRLIAELTWNTFRNHLILEYEIPKYDGDMGQPNVLFPLEEIEYQNKVRFIMEAFPSQYAKKWLEESTFLSLMRLRGMECNALSGYAEAFHCRKAVL